MKSPIENITGTITDYDERTGKMTIVAHYPNWVILCKRGYKKCLVQPIDSRPLSDKQRKMCYSLLRAISDETGMGVDPAKEYMKIKFLAEDMQETADKILSLSSAPMSLVCAFQRFLIRFILEWDIPCDFSLLEYADDIPDYIYHCLMTKKCCVCGKPTDLHHIDRIGMGRNRNDIIHEGMEVLPLCREHHTQAHTMTDAEFFELYHIPGGIAMDKTMCRLYGLKRKKEN